jgi:hypothetical protein
MMRGTAANRMIFGRKPEFFLFVVNGKYIFNHQTR